MLPNLTFLPKRYDRYLDIMFRIPGSGLAWTIAIAVSIAQIYVSWAYLATFIFCCFLTWLPASFRIPLPQYKFPPLHFSPQKDEDYSKGAIYVFMIPFLSIKYEKLNESFICGIKINVLSRAAIICVILVWALLTIMSILFGWTQATIWEAGFPDYWRGIFSTLYIENARFYFMSDILSGWQGIWLRIFLWPVPSIYFWFIIMNLLYRKDLLIVKDMLQPDEKLSEGKKRLKARRSNVYGTIYLIFFAILAPSLIIVAFADSEHLTIFSGSVSNNESVLDLIVTLFNLLGIDKHGILAISAVLLSICYILPISARFVFHQLTYSRSNSEITRIITFANSISLKKIILRRMRR